MLGMPPMRKSAGFTLIELMVGIVIMLIVLALGMPSYQAWIQNSRIRNAAESILAGLQLARAEAVSRNAPVRFTLGTGSSWTVRCVTLGANCPDPIQSRATGDGSSTAVTVVASDAMPIVFNSLGQMTSPVPAAGALTQIDVDVDSAILSAAQSRDLRITVDVGGRIRMCDPNVAIVVPPTDSRACNS